ncbi:hypothetical protein FQN50_008877 [Emmonsiellopsis sp. PD_5]|nr:hypothetical protein FQN50_008877 [Emmonsiellopsis sp. PD_5]
MAGGNKRQIRSACDRCHAQKLRCERRHGQDSCARCVRLEASCIFSPRHPRTVTRPPRPRLKHQGPVNEKCGRALSGLEGTSADRAADTFHIPLQEGTDSQSLELDNRFQLDLAIPESLDTSHRGWSDTDLLVPGTSFQGDEQFSFLEFCNDLDVSRSPFQHETAMSVPCTSTSIPPDGDAPAAKDIMRDTPTTPTQYVRQLADLNVGLCENAAKLPPESIKPSDVIASLGGRVLAIEDSFRLIQSLMDVVNAVYSWPHAPTEQIPQGSATPSPFSFITRNTTCTRGSRLGPIAPSDRVPDQATVLLVLSCYERAMDIFQIVLTHIESCLKNPVLPISSNGSPALLPQLQIGSFQPPTESAAAMKMLLFLIMAQQLFDQLQHVLRVPKYNEIGCLDGNGDGGSVGDMPGNNGGDTLPVQDTVWQNHLAPDGYNRGSNDSGPEFSDKTRQDIWARSRWMSERVVNIRNMLMDSSMMR